MELFYRPQIIWTNKQRKLGEFYERKQQSRVVGIIKSSMAETIRTSKLSLSMLDSSAVLLLVFLLAPYFSVLMYMENLCNDMREYLYVESCIHGQSQQTKEK